MLKKCSKCKLEKPIEKFWIKNKTKGIHKSEYRSASSPYSQCYECRTEKYIILKREIFIKKYSQRNHLKKSLKNGENVNIKILEKLILFHQ